MILEESLTPLGHRPCSRTRTVTHNVQAFSSRQSCPKADWLPVPGPGDTEADCGGQETLPGGHTGT